jgi:hypothetical protein
MSRIIEVESCTDCPNKMHIINERYFCPNIGIFIDDNMKEKTIPLYFKKEELFK